MAKAKVWASLGEYVPIVALERWAEDPAAGWPLTAPDYPQLGSLAAGWFSVRLAGGWSPTAAGLAWLWIYLLLLAGLWGRLADFAGYGSAFVGVFLLGSLPLIQTHVALAGYLDFWLCAFYGFAAMALAGAARGQPRSWFFLLAFALCLPLLKREGWVWMLTLLPAAVVARYRFRGMLGVAIVTVALAGAALAIGIEFANVELSAERIAIPGLVDYPLALEEGLRALVKNLLVLESWHVAIWFVPVVLLLMIRQLSHAELQAGLVLLLGGFCFFVLLFLFTPAATWVRSHTITSRIVMQQMAALIFFGWLAVSYWLRSSERYSDRIDPAQSSMEKQGVASI